MFLTLARYFQNNIDKFLFKMCCVPLTNEFILHSALQKCTIMEVNFLKRILGIEAQFYLFGQRKEFRKARFRKQMKYIIQKIINVNIQVQNRMNYLFSFIKIKELHWKSQLECKLENQQLDNKIKDDHFFSDFF